jgi:hypothetical protein
MRFQLNGCVVRAGRTACSPPGSRLGFRIAVADAVEPPPRGVDTEDDLVIIRVLARQAASLEQKR